MIYYASTLCKLPFKFHAIINGMGCHLCQNGVNNICDTNTLVYYDLLNPYQDLLNRGLWQVYSMIY